MWLWLWQRVSCWSSQQRQQFSWVKWREIADWWECSAVSWKSVCEAKTRRLLRNGRQPGIQLVELSVDKNSERTAVTRRPECGKLKNLSRSRCQETASGVCNRLTALVCVCQWNMKCSSTWCIQVVRKSNSPIHTLSVVTHINCDIMFKIEFSKLLMVT
jgi:hypothetical protein